MLRHGMRTAARDKKFSQLGARQRYRDSLRARLGLRKYDVVAVGSGFFSSGGKLRKGSKQGVGSPKVCMCV